MSEEFTDKLPPEPSKDTNPMLDRILEEVRAGRAETASLREEVTLLREETRREISSLREEMQAGFARLERRFEDLHRSYLRDLAHADRVNATRYLELEERMTAFEERERQGSQPPRQP